MKKILILAITLVLFCVSYSMAESEPTDFYLSEFENYIDDQAPFDITDYIGENLIISFWTTWCPHCVKEIPDFVKFQNDYSDQVRVLMVHVPSNETFDKAQEFFKKNNYEDTLELLQDNGFYAKAFNLQGFPTNLVFNKEGKLIHYGYATDYESLKALFEKNNLFEVTEKK